MPRAKTRYRVLTGLDYGNTRAEPGEVVDDIPQESTGWLLEQGLIEPEDAAAVPPPAASPTGSEVLR